jgi:hypothetical protein
MDGAGEPRLPSLGKRALARTSSSVPDVAARAAGSGGFRGRRIAGLRRQKCRTSANAVTFSFSLQAALRSVPVSRAGQRKLASHRFCRGVSPSCRLHSLNPCLGHGGQEPFFWWVTSSFRGWQPGTQGFGDSGTRDQLTFIKIYPMIVAKIQEKARTAFFYCIQFSGCYRDRGLSFSSSPGRHRAGFISRFQETQFDLASL